MKTLFLLFFLGLSIVVGGTLYSALVVESLWSSNPPESLRQWGPAVQYAGDQFWSRVTPFVGLLALVTAVTSFRVSPRDRRWLLTAALLFLAALIWTLVYFVPTVDAILASPESSGDLVRRWVSLDFWRILLIVAAWLCAARAITLGPAGEVAKPLQPSSV